MNIYLVCVPTTGAKEIARGLAEGKRKLPHDTVRLLLSYHYYKNHDVMDELAELAKVTKLELFADSGAFSAWTLGKPIKMEEYVEWLVKWGHLFTVVAALDQVGNGEQSYKQTKQLISMLPANIAKKVIPVYHATDFDSWKWLKRYYEEFEYVGLSPMGLRPSRKLIDAWCEKAFALKPPETKVHGFGVGTWMLLLKYPWHSCDASTWVAGLRYAQLRLFSPRKRKIDYVRVRQRKVVMENVELLAYYGLGLRHIHPDRLSANRNVLLSASCESWQRVEDFVTEKWR